PPRNKMTSRCYAKPPLLPPRGRGELSGAPSFPEEKKRDRLWNQLAELLPKLGLAPARIDHLMTQRRPELIAQLVKELEGKS
ncbi:MAG TPA: hypothetical protein PKC45_00695, partial [Gemmatales bacterium]|nr:hypothetical protein [Gemmatales bacterium]